MNKNVPMDFTGQKYGRLLVVGYSHKENGYHYYDCICDCSRGQDTRPIIKVKGKQLRSGDTMSCGCLRREANNNNQPKNQKPQLSKEVISQLPYYKEIENRWNSMKYHYINPNSRNYKYFGARGLKVYPLWLDEKIGLILFYSWAITNGFTDNCKILRKDKNKDYEPENLYISIHNKNKAKPSTKTKTTTKSKSNKKVAKTLKESKVSNEQKERYQQVNIINNDILLMTADNTQISLLQLLKEFGVDLTRVAHNDEADEREAISQKPDSVFHRFKKLVGF